MIIPLIAGAFILYGISKSNSSDNVYSNPDRMVDMKRLFNLKDVDPDDQGGTWKKDYDFVFEASADHTGVPFALLKAHSIMESSLNPKAFLDENPQKNPKRIGWASRGLMQLLYWPNSTRFEKYGFKSTTGDELFESVINVEIAAKLIADNLRACGGNIRDAINMYNTGKKESALKAPHNYVDRVLSNYETLIKGKV